MQLFARSLLLRSANLQAKNITSNDACICTMIVISLEGMLPSFDASLWSDHPFKGGVFQSVKAM